MAPRAFISFQMEDKWARGFLVQHAKEWTFALLEPELTMIGLVPRSS